MKGKVILLEDDLVLFYRSLVEDLCRYVLGCDIDALGPSLIQHIRKQAHLELESKDINAGDVLFAALQDDLLDEEAGHWHIDRPHRHHSSCLLAVEGGEALNLFSLVGPEDQVNKCGFLLL